MGIVTAWRALNRDQRNAYAASLMGWMLDAFDYFLLVFVLKDVADEFHVPNISLALTLTLAFRPIGALVFGLAADRWGRRGPLMVDIILYSILEFLTGFAPTLTSFLVLRSLFGIAMGGEWGLGASLALETVPAEHRGLLSGLLQEGYVLGYLLAALVYGIAFPYVGWRGLFIIGVLPVMLPIFILRRVKESPVWMHQPRETGWKPLVQEVQRNFPLFLYLVALMTAFNFMSHGTQDLYPTLLRADHHFSTGLTSRIAIVYNIGALVGGMFFGGISQRIGRRRAIIIAAVLAIPLIRLWAFSPTALSLGIGAFLMQFMVQGAWGVVPAHLAELAPAALRGTFIGFSYQCGNLIASSNASIQTHLAERSHAGYARAMAPVVACALIGTAVITALGKEKKGIGLGQKEAVTPLNATRQRRGPESYPSNSS